METKRLNCDCEPDTPKPPMNYNLPYASKDLVIGSFKGLGPQL